MTRISQIFQKKSVPIRATPALAPGASVCGKERDATARWQLGLIHGNLMKYTIQVFFSHTLRLN
jgi:hypothetical protein